MRMFRLKAKGGKTRDFASCHSSAAFVLCGSGSDCTCLAIGELIGFLEGGRRGSGSHLLLEVERYVAQLFFDVAHYFSLGSGGEGVAALSQDLHQVVREVSAREVQTEDGVRQRVTW